MNSSSRDILTNHAENPTNTFKTAAGTRNSTISLNAAYDNGPDQIHQNQDPFTPASEFTGSF